ncbi:MAG: hypothetical protein Q4A74_09925, partial [Cardiobacteriaceae bacterium]|nr:hypothetical protein [Cardiobacteriaceae bacterium]
PYLKEALQTRGIIIEEYGQIAKELYKMGHKTEARIISKLAREVAGQSFNTQAQDKFDRLAGNSRAVEQLRNQSEQDVQR